MRNRSRWDELVSTGRVNDLSLTMIYDARELARVRNPVILLSAMTWILLVFGLGRMFAHCPATKSGMSSPVSFQMLLAMNPPARLAAGWLLVAMMSPVLSGALLIPLRGCSMVGISRQSRNRKGYEWRART